MTKVKVFIGSPNSVEQEVNEWIAEVEGRGAKITQIAPYVVVRGFGDAQFFEHVFWVLYQE